MLALNLGCGPNKIPDCINIDCEVAAQPDVLWNLISDGPLPYEAGSIDEIYLFHTIEHIQKKNHPVIFAEANRLLKAGGKFYISYPEFEKVVRCWLSNFQGKRQFWEATIFGRQLYPSDYHVCAIDSEYYLRDILMQRGFNQITFTPERNEPYNTICLAHRCDPFCSYEELIFREVLQ